MNFVINFIKRKYYIIGLVISLILVLFGIYFIENFIFNMFFSFLQIIFYEHNSCYYLSIFIMITIHYLFIRQIISSILFPSGYYFSKWIILINMFEETIRTFEYDLNYLEKYKDRYFSKDEENTNFIHIYEEKIKNFKQFSILLTDSKKNNCDMNFEKFNFEISNNNLLSEIEKLQGCKDIYKSTDFSNLSTNLQILKDNFNKFKEGFSRLNQTKIFNFMKLRFNTIFKSSKLEKIEINKSIYAFLLRPKHTLSNTLLIFCSPNAMCAEYYSLTKSLIDFYLKKNIAVLLWNYAGYGDRSGSATLTNINSDSETIMNYMMNNYNSTFTKIGIHGFSIGGLVACHLANKYSNISFIIADRTLSTIDKVIEKIFPCGLIFKYFYKIIFPSFLLNSITYSSTVVNYVRANTPSKLILYDGNDEIIPFEASLKYELTEFLFNKYIKKEICSYFSFDYTKSTNISISKIIFTNEDMEKIKLKFFHIMRFYNKLQVSKTKNEPQTLESNIDLDYIERFFEVFLFKEHPYINLINFYETFDNFMNEFLMNLFVWGYYEYHTSSIIFENPNQNYNFKNVPILISYFCSKANNLIKLINKSEIEEIKQVYNLIDINVNDDVIVHLKDFISLFLSKINLIFIRIYFDKKASGSLSNLTNDQILNCEFSDQIIYDAKVNSQFKDNSKNFGNIINLSCGHNGEYSIREKEMIEQFLNNL